MIKAKSKVTSYLRGALGLEQEGEPTFPKKMAHMRRNSYKSNMSKRRQYAQESTYLVFANMQICRDKFEGGKIDRQICIFTRQISFVGTPY